MVEFSIAVCRSADDGSYASGSIRLSIIEMSAGRFVQVGAFIGMRNANRGSGVGFGAHCWSPGGSVAVVWNPDCDPETRKPLPT